MSKEQAIRGKLRFLSSNPGKRAVERFWLLYTPVWGTICGIIMVGGFANHWTDLPLMILGVGLAAGALIPPLVFRPAEERGKPFWQLTAFKYGFTVFGFAFGLNYTQTPFFWDVLHMHYGFGAEITIRNNPVFLYFLSIPYFATYAVLCTGTYRFVKQGLAGRPRMIQWGAVAIAPFFVAGMETLMNANPWTTSLFCYDDMVLMSWFGTFAYGTAFCLALPVWITIDEKPQVNTKLFSIVIWVLAALYADLILLDLYRYHIAPHVTTVVENANGLRDFATSCLQAIP
jgi:cycloeucalenol cycloisomerase